MSDYMPDDVTPCRYPWNCDPHCMIKSVCVESVKAEDRARRQADVLGSKP